MMTSQNRHPDFKILASIPKDDGSGDFLTPIGRGFRNKDQSINAVLATLPFSAFMGKQVRLQIREWDDRDERPRAPSSRDVVSAAPADGDTPF